MHASHGSKNTCSRGSWESQPDDCLFDNCCMAIVGCPSLVRLPFVELMWLKIGVNTVTLFYRHNKRNVAQVTTSIEATETQPWWSRSCLTKDVFQANVLLASNCRKSFGVKPLTHLSYKALIAKNQDKLLITNTIHTYVSKKSLMSYTIRSGRTLDVFFVVCSLLIAHIKIWKS